VRNGWSSDQVGTMATHNQMKITSVIDKLRTISLVIVKSVEAAKGKRRHFGLKVNQNGADAASFN